MKSLKSKLFLILTAFSLLIIFPALAQPASACGENNYNWNRNDYRYRGANYNNYYRDRDYNRNINRDDRDRRDREERDRRDRDERARRDRDDRNNYNTNYRRNDGRYNVTSYGYNNRNIYRR